MMLPLALGIGFVDLAEMRGSHAPAFHATARRGPEIDVPARKDPDVGHRGIGLQIRSPPQADTGDLWSNCGVLDPQQTVLEVAKGDRFSDSLVSPVAVLALAATGFALLSR